MIYDSSFSDKNIGIINVNYGVKSSPQKKSKEPRNPILAMCINILEATKVSEYTELAAMLNGCAENVNFSHAYIEALKNSQYPYITIREICEELLLSEKKES